VPIAAGFEISRLGVPNAAGAKMKFKLYAEPFAPGHNAEKAVG
jgi:hypothetical protein